VPRDRTYQSERLTRRERIDPQLTAAGWTIAPYGLDKEISAYDAHAIEEFPIASGPADYALVVDGQLVGVVEAKKLTLGPQGVLTQAERYARGVVSSAFNYRGFRVPFLFSTNGEVIWFHDIRHELELSRKIARFFTPAALAERLRTDAATEYNRLELLPNNHPRLRPYQIEANAAVERAIVDGKRQMLVAMATGTGKTFTIVNQIYRLMKTGAARRILFLVDRRALAALDQHPELRFDDFVIAKDRERANAVTGLPGMAVAY
jgi:type I restriction enzyme R subunit